MDAIHKLSPNGKWVILQQPPNRYKSRKLRKCGGYRVFFPSGFSHFWASFFWVPRKSHLPSPSHWGFARIRTSSCCISWSPCEPMWLRRGLPKSRCEPRRFEAQWGAMGGCLPVDGWPFASWHRPRLRRWGAKMGCAVPKYQWVDCRLYHGKPSKRFRNLEVRAWKIHAWSSFCPGVEHYVRFLWGFLTHELGTLMGLSSFK